MTRAQSETKEPALFRRTINRLLSGSAVAPPERRNALTLQTVLIVMAIAATAMTVHAIVNRHDATPSDLWGPLAIAAVSLFCLRLIHVGRYRLAAALSVCGGLALVGLSYALYGLQAQGSLQMNNLIPLLFAGLLLGRAAVWWTALANGILLALGARVDLMRAADAAATAQVLPDLLLAILNFLILAVILDRLILSSQQAAERSDELEREIEEKERVYARLLHTQRLEAMGRLSANVAHEFDNILHVILGLSNEPTATSDRDRTLTMIRQAAQRGTTVTRRLLTFSRNQDRHVSVFDLVEAVDHMRPMLEPLFPPEIHARIDTAASPMPVKTDRDELEMVLLNMAGNARDAMPDGGRFGLVVERDGNEAVIRVEDTGVGMAPEVRARLFEPFFTTKPKGSGTGLGMTFVRRFVTDSGGRIDVESAPGRGTRICVRLPLAGHSEGRREDPPGRLRVLLVTRDDAAATQASQTLRAQGYRVDTATNGDEALVYALYAQHLDAVIADQDLPDIDGATLLWQLGNVAPNAKRILLCESYPADLDQRQILHLPKPFDGERMLHALRVS